MNKNEKFVQLLKDRFGGSQAEAARTLKKSTAQIHQWVSGYRNLGNGAAREIEITLNLPQGWFDGSNQNFVTAPMGKRPIPLINSVQAGNWRETVDNYEPGDAADWLSTDLELSESAFALEIKGDSMLPDFKPGDRVIIDPEIAPNPGDFVVAKNGSNEATFKKYRPRSIDGEGNEVFELVPLNEDYPTMRSDASHIHIIGTMVEHRRYRKK